MENTLFGKLLVQRKKEACAKLKEAFAVFDKEKTGFIKCEDVGNVLRSLGDNPTDEQVKDVIGVLDVDKNGVVEFSTFLNFLVPTLKDGDPEEVVKSAFKFLDKDEDGFISAAELSDVLASLGEAVTDEEVKAMVKTADLDGDGKVSYEDLKKMLLRM